MGGKGEEAEDVLACELGCARGEEVSEEKSGASFMETIDRWGARHIREGYLTRKKWGKRLK